MSRIWGEKTCSLPFSFFENQLKMHWKFVINKDTRSQTDKGVNEKKKEKPPDYMAEKHPR